MIFLFKIIVLVTLIQLLIKMEKPELCAGIYAVVVLILSLLFGAGLVNSLIGMVISGVLAFAYFWLLDRSRETFWFWVFMLGGIAIGLV